MDRRKLRRGVEEVKYDHLRGRLDVEAMLGDLGIDTGYWANKNNLMCHCPNLDGHHENGDASPSFGFDQEKLAFNCFVAGGGNVIELVQMMKPGTSDQDAITYLEQFADLNVSQEGMEDRIRAILNPPPEETNVMPDYPPDSLFQYRKIHPYLYERGLTKDVIVEMQVGFDEEHAGITMPHFFMGKLVGLQRRHLIEDAKLGFWCPRCAQDPKHKNKIPKYKNTAGFPRNNTLYGYDQMKEYLKAEQGKSAIVIESPFSVLKLKSLGFHRCASSFGQWSVEHSMLLIAIPTVYYWPDNDVAGVKNTERCIDTLARFTNLLIVPAVPGEKADAGDLNDPNDVSRYLQAAFPAALWPKYRTGQTPPTIEDIPTTKH